MRRIAVPLLAVTTVLAVMVPAAATLREVDVGNFYFEDVATGNRELITANKGDQLRFTVRQAAYSPHDVVIEGYGDGYESGPLLLLETFTTPPLDKAGTFPLYCRAHRRRGHETTLVVKSGTTASSPAPTPPPRKKSTPKPGASGSPQASPTSAGSVAPGVTPSPGMSPSLAPAGVGVATDRRLASPDANSLAGILGRDIGGGEPWTTAVWQWLLAAIPIMGLAGFAMRRALQR